MRSLLLPASLLWICGSLPTLHAATQRPPITGIAYVRFLESDLPGAKTFFGTRLGLPETDMPGGAESFAVGVRQRIEIAPLPSPVPSSRLAMVGFLTPNVDAMARFLEEHHVALERKSVDEIRLRDPEGNPIAFVSETRSAAADRKTELLPAGSAGAATSRRIIHAGWGVRSAATEDGFYRTLLGFRPYWHGGMKDDGAVAWSSLQVPEGTDWIEYMLEYRPGLDARFLGVLNHVSLGVADIHEADRQLIANGWTDASTRKSQIGRDGKWQLNVFDPDQSRVEFMEFKPVREPCCSPFTGPQPTEQATR